MRVEKVGVDDNFFDLGGNSLLLMETHAKLCLALKVELPIMRLRQFDVQSDPFNELAISRRALTVSGTPPFSIPSNS